MKKIFNVGVMALAITAVLSGCSKNTDMSEAEVQQYQQEKKVAELRKAYSTAFAKAFGTISPNNAWGFDRTTGSVTRTASVRETLFWDIPEICGVVLQTRKAGMRMKQKMISRTINLLLF